MGSLCTSALTLGKKKEGMRAAIFGGLGEQAQPLPYLGRGTALSNAIVLLRARDVSSQRFPSLETCRFLSSAGAGDSEETG